MPDMIKTGLMIAGAVAVAFAGCAGLVGLGPDMPGLLNMPVSHKIEVLPVTQTVDVKFHKVTGPQPTREEGARQAREQEFQMTRIGAKMFNTEVSESLLTAAYDDAPTAAGYFAFAPLDRLQIYTDVDREDGRDMKIGCLSYADPDPESRIYGAHHIIFKYDAKRFKGDEAVTLGQWIFSGCAQAIQSQGRRLNQTQANLAMRDMMPDTPEYAEARRNLLAQLNANSPLNTARRQQGR